MVQLWHNVRKDLWPGPHGARGSKEFQPHHNHHQHQQTIIVFPLLCMLVIVGLLVSRSGIWNCGKDGHSLDSQITSRPHPKNAKQSTSAARICRVRSAESSLMCNDGRLLTQRRREKIDIVTANSLGHIPTGHCMLAQQWFISNPGRLWSLFDDCFKYRHRYEVVHISHNWKWWPQRSPSAYNCYQFLYTFCPYAMKSNLLADPLLPLLIVHQNLSDDGRWYHVICDRPSPTGLPQVWQVTTPPSDPS